jgi:DNA-binding NarL/FixJ family response regulator
MVSVCLCDPQPVVQQGLEGLLERSGDFKLLESSLQLVGVAALVRHTSPEVLILDRSFGIHAALEAISELKQSAPAVHVVVWGAAISDIECFRLLQVSARGILKKTAPPKETYHCLKRVSQNALWSEDLYHSSNAQPQPTRSRPLTRTVVPRQFQLSTKATPIRPSSPRAWGLA